VRFIERSPLNSLSNFGKLVREKTDDIYVTELCCSYVCVLVCELERWPIFIWRTLTGKPDVSECEEQRVIAIALYRFLKMSVKLWWPIYGPRGHARLEYSSRYDHRSRLSAFTITS
jgi:hypothetical protein